LSKDNEDAAAQVTLKILFSKLAFLSGLGGVVVVVGGGK